MTATGPYKGGAPLTIVIIVGAALSLLAFASVSRFNADRATAQFSSRATGYANLVADGFEQVIFAIESVGAFYGTSDSVTAAQFAEFAAPMLDRFPTISALGWVPRVMQQNRNVLEKATRLKYPGFRITEIGPDKELVPAGARPVYFPVQLIRPYRGNEAAHGFDIYSNPVRRAAIDAAIDSGRTTSTARIRLVQETGRQYSVLIINPVFGHRDPVTENRQVRGVASAVYRIGDGVDRALAQVGPIDTNVWLFDRSGGRDNQFLYFHRAGRPTADREEDVPDPPTAGVRHVHDFRLGERDFQLVFAPKEDRFNRDGNYLAWTAFCVGLLFTALLAAYMALMLRRSRDLHVGREALLHEIRVREHAEQQLREVNVELQNLSREDPVMGIANRRFFDEYFEQEWKRAMRHKTPLSLLIGDVDRFKSYNDTFGHIAGDKCLRRIARVLREALERPGDLVARYGGEELALVLPSTPEKGAHDLAEKIRILVSSMSPTEADAPSVTMSIGYGTIEPQRDSSMEEFIRAVDDALYRAKQRGRNRAVSIESGA